MELKKSYKGFVIWLIGFCLICFGTAFLPIDDGVVLGRIICNICTMGIALLAFIIYKTEYVYWYTGIDYEEAVKVGSERRKEYARKHFYRFGLFAVVFLVYTLISQILSLSYWIDVVIVTIGMVAVAISTIRFKL